MGLSHSSIAPYDAFPTRDGQILIAEDGERPGLSGDGLGRADGGDRLAHAFAIDDSMAGPFGREQVHGPNYVTAPGLVQRPSRSPSVSR